MKLYIEVFWGLPPANTIFSVAEQSGIERHVLSLILSRKVRATDEQLVALHRALKCPATFPPSKLFDEVDLGELVTR